jgi:flagellar basal body-associated protein FliL
MMETKEKKKEPGALATVFLWIALAIGIFVALYAAFNLFWPKSESKKPEGDTIDVDHVEVVEDKK